MENAKKVMAGQCHEINSLKLHSERDVKKVAPGTWGNLGEVNCGDPDITLALCHR